MYFGAAQSARMAVFEWFRRFFARIWPHAAAPIPRMKKPRRAAALGVGLKKRGSAARIKGRERRHIHNIGILSA